jgi:hypothetical protein
MEWRFGGKNGEVNRTLAKKWRRNGKEMAKKMAKYYALNI